MARPSRYDPGKLALIEAWASSGLTHAQIAANLGVGLRTLYGWQAEHDDFAEALAAGREVADLLVENALFRRAVGFEYTEATYELRKDLDTGEDRMVETKRVRKTMPPDVGAITVWLENRMPEKWRRQPEPPPAGHDYSGDISFVGALDDAARAAWLAEPNPQDKLMAALSASTAEVFADFDEDEARRQGGPDDGDSA